MKLLTNGFGPVNSLPKDKIVNWTKQKAFAGKLHVAEMMIYLLDELENIVAEASFSRVVKLCGKCLIK